jgi:hypothetical protein
MSPTSKRAHVAAGLAGLLFGLGLAVSGMTQPGKVIAFLDVAGAFDPSLAFVMAGAIAVHALAHRLITRRRAPLFDRTFHLPRRTDVDRRLLVGAALFGVGWGLGGFCPGPALVSLATLRSDVIVFVLAMTTGMLLQHVFGAVPAPPDATSKPPVATPSAS